MEPSYPEDPTDESADRVRRSTDVELNHQIDRQTDANIKSYASFCREDV